MPPPRVRVADTPDLGMMWYLLDDDYNFIPEVLAFLNFKATSGRGATPRTRKRITERLRWFYHFLWLYQLNILQLSATHLEQFATWLQNPYRQIEPNEIASSPCELSITSYNAILDAMAALFKYMVARKWILESPVLYRLSRSSKHSRSTDHHYNVLSQELKCKVPDTSPKIISKEDFARFLKHIYPHNDPYRHPAAYRNWLLCLIMVEGGFRIGEILGIHIEDIVFEEDSIYVRFRPESEGKAFAKNGFGRDRFVLMPRPLMNHLRFYLTEIWPLGGGNTEYVWINFQRHAQNNRGDSTFGHALQPATINKLFAYHAERAKIQIHPHKLRHTNITATAQAYIILDEPIDWKNISVRAGHSSVVTTIEIYAHLDVTDQMAMDRRVAERRRADQRVRMSKATKY